MSNPVKDYTKIENALLEALCGSNLTNREFRVLLYVLRQTNGYLKNADWIAFSQFVEGTKIRRQHLHATVKRLIAKKWLIKEENMLKITLPPFPGSVQSQVGTKIVPPVGTFTVPHGGNYNKILTKDRKKENLQFLKHQEKTRRNSEIGIYPEWLTHEPPKPP